MAAPRTSAIEIFGWSGQRMCGYKIVDVFFTKDTFRIALIMESYRGSGKLPRHAYDATFPLQW